MLQLRASLCCKIASWLTFASMSLIASTKAISSSVAMRVGRSWFSVLAQQLQGQSPEPLVWTVEGVLSLTERDALGFSGGGALRPLIHLRQRTWNYIHAV